MLLRLGIRTLVSGTFGLALLLAGSGLASGPGVVVESIVPGGAAQAAGLRPEDRLLFWARTAPAPGASAGDDARSVSRPTVREGPFRSPADVQEIEIEQAPLGRITLIGERSGEALSIDLPPGSWGLRVRPRLTGAVLDGYRQAAGEKEAGDLQRAVARLRDLATGSGMEPVQGAWLVHRAAEWLAEGGLWEGASSVFDQAARSAGASGDSRMSAALQYLEGELCEKASRFEEATSAYGEVLATWQRLSPESLSVAAGLFRLGRVAMQRGDLQGAEDRYRQALAIRERLAPGSLDVAEVLNALGMTLRRVARPEDLEEAEGCHRRALQIQQAIAPDTLDGATTLNSLGNVAWLRGDLASAETYYRKALGVRERLAPGSLGHAATLDNLGLVATRRGDLASAESHFHQALVLRERVAPGSLAVAMSFNNLGGAAAHRGNLVAAEEFFKRSHEIRQRLAPVSDEVASALSNLGVVAWERRDLAAAEDYYRQSLAMKEQLAPDSLDVAWGLSNLGNVAVERGDLASAADLYHRSLAIKERLAPESPDVAVDLKHLGEVDRARGALGSADARFQRALAIHERVAPGSLMMAEALNGLGQVAEERGDLVVAMGFHRQALAIRERLAPGSRLPAESAGAQARLFRRAGDLQASVAHYEKAVTALETQQRRLGGVEEVRTAFRSRYAETYREMVDLLVDLRRPAEAFQVVERSRAQGLLSLMAERDLVLSRDIPEGLERERRRLAADYDRAQEALSGLSSGKEPEQVENLVADLQDLRRRQSEIREEIRKQSPRLAALRYPEPLDLARARRVLDAGTALLLYSVGRDRTHLFVIDRDGGLAVEKLPAGEAALRDQVQGFRAAIVESRRSAASGDAQRRGERLYGTLVAPVAGRLESADRVLIVPDGPLHSLPFATLVRPAATEKTGWQYLVEWKPIHLAASVTVYGQLQKARSKEGARGSPALVAFGDPRYPRLEAGSENAPGDPVLRSLVTKGQAFKPLPSAREEVQAIAGLFGDGATAYLGAEATEERARASGHGPRLIHFAAHGLIDPTFPLDSAIVLSIPEKIQYGQDNGLLQAWEVFESLRIDADLVTLSACETALGGEMAGEGILGLTRAFQYAGARSVLASLWSVADRSTAELMKRFYGYLKEGRSKDEALRAAQVDLIRGGVVAGPGADSARGVKGLAKGKGPSRAHAGPFYWAAFELIGDWR